jgi:hypothetical protein
VGAVGKGVSRGRETRRLVERRHRMPFCVCCNASLASRPRYGRSFRLENWVEPHSESFFRKYTLSTIYP